MMKSNNDTVTQYDSRKDYFANYRKKKRGFKFKHLETYQTYAVGEDKRKLGFKASIMTRKGDIKRLPPYFNFLLSACEEFIDNRNRFPSLRFCSAMNREDSRRRTMEVLCVLLVRCEMYHGRIGEPTTSGMDTVSHDTLMEDYVLRFGKVIEPSTWRTCVKRLERAGLYNQKRNYVGVTVDDRVETRSFPAYKHLTGQFFKEVKVVSYQEVVEMIQNSRTLQEAKGLQFKWINFRELASRKIALWTAVSLNKESSLTLEFADAPISPPH
ncbi:hypothetical protein ACODM8_15855 [Vibrio ostreicida]|uniref:hypothetical protein n=1 Tax=Vibrio ostreicida TaxID=526588 RepID=UPI003B5CB98F